MLGMGRRVKGSVTSSGSPRRPPYVPDGESSRIGSQGEGAVRGGRIQSPMAGIGRALLGLPSDKNEVGGAAAVGAAETGGGNRRAAGASGGAVPAALTAGSPRTGDDPADVGVGAGQ